MLAEERTPGSGEPVQFAPRLRKLARRQPLNTVQIAAHTLDKRAEQDLVHRVTPCPTPASTGMARVKQKGLTVFEQMS
jgi:hypothetical protein